MRDGGRVVNRLAVVLAGLGFACALLVMGASVYSMVTGPFRPKDLAYAVANAVLAAVIVGSVFRNIRGRSR